MGRVEVRAVVESVKRVVPEVSMKTVSRLPEARTAVSEPAPKLPILASPVTRFNHENGTPVWSVEIRTLSAPERHMPALVSASKL